MLIFRLSPFKEITIDDGWDQLNRSFMFVLMVICGTVVTVRQHTGMTLNTSFQWWNGQFYHFSKQILPFVLSPLDVSSRVFSSHSFQEFNGGIMFCRNRYIIVSRVHLVECRHSLSYYRLMFWKYHFHFQIWLSMKLSWSKSCLNAW